MKGELKLLLSVPIQILSRVLAISLGEDDWIKAQGEFHVSRF